MFFFIFRETPQKFQKERNILIFQETFYISGSNFRSLKNEKKIHSEKCKKNVFQCIIFFIFIYIKEIEKKNTKKFIKNYKNL